MARRVTDKKGLLLLSARHLLELRKRNGSTTCSAALSLCFLINLAANIQGLAPHFRIYAVDNIL